MLSDFIILLKLVFKYRTRFLNNVKQIQDGTWLKQRFNVVGKELK